MPRRSATLFVLLALAISGPAAAATPFACRIGPRADDSFLLAERFEMAVRPEARRTEYRLLVQNPHPYPAAVLTGIELYGLVQSPAEPVLVPPGGQASVLIGWFPHDMSAGRRAPPMIEEVRAGMTIPFCEVLAPDHGQVAMPMAGRRAPRLG
ncbi:hypothetical protein ACLF3G_07700 [Falsiroseomonas sp. HC035]|uniref:hypothetical protein n=1 Tax=Falsiroseomonas sp. HC035 TaxID=3390999 RepID=UPI003D31D88B